MHRIALPVAIIAILLSVAAFASDWPQFRGLNADGISREKGINKNWNQNAPKKLWGVPMGDDGYAGHSVASGRVFIIDHKDKQDIVRAIDIKTGKDVWQYSYPDSADANFGFSRATPTVSGGRVYALGRMGLLNCLEAKTGKLLWSRDICADFKGKKPGWNYSMSILVDGNRAIACPGGPDATIVALDKTTGKTLWQGGGSRALGYDTPVVATINGKRQYVVLTDKDVISLDAATGAELWVFDWPDTRGARIPQPVPIGDSVFINSGYGHGCALADIADGVAKKRWENKEMQAQMASPIYKDGYIYGNTDPGDFVCIDVKTGAAKWRQSGFEKGPVIMVDDVLLAFDGKGGDLVMVKPTPDAYNEIGRFKPLGGQSWTSPAVANGKLIVRNKTELACFDLK